MMCAFSVRAPASKRNAQRMIRSQRLALLLPLLVLVPVTACSGAGLVADAPDEEDALSSQNKIAKWIYDGPLPALDKSAEPIALAVSQKAHTLLVTGILPADFEGRVPFYADTEAVTIAGASRTRIAVVYPIATGITFRPQADLADVHVLPHFTQADHFGGFPFIWYLQFRGRVAFHGPITDDGTSWRLRRGQVSHGCNRMQGEHVVELAQLLGVDMTKPHDTSEGGAQGFDEKVKLKVHPDFVTWKGHQVDVAYPVDVGVTLPTGDVMKFPTWSSRAFPRSVCEYRDTARPLDGHYCDSAGTNAAGLYSAFAPVP